MKTLQAITLSLAVLILLGCKDVPKTETNEEQEKVRAVFTNWVKELSESESADAYFKYVTNDFMPR